VNLQFRSVSGPPVSLIEGAAARDPSNPFSTTEYVRARESLNAKACLIGLYHGTELVSGGISFVSGSFLRRSLDIPSLPSAPEPATFWQGILQLCRALKVWRLEVNTYGSRTAEIPQLPGELTRRTRYEYVIDLPVNDIFEGVSSQHRRNISRASKAGLTIRRTREESAYTQHREVMDASLERRAKRGETIDRGGSALALALLANKSGEIFQAVHGEQVLSSIMVLRSSTGAYYQSAGTRPEGMKLGASPFLVSQVARILKHEGAQIFNLGGAGEDSTGLRRFKAGFNAREIALQAASFCPKSAPERKLHTALRSCWAWVKQS